MPFFLERVEVLSRIAHKPKSKPSASGCDLERRSSKISVLRRGTGGQFRGHTGPGPHTVGRRLCAVQAFWADGPKPWRRANSFRPSIVIKRVEPPSGRRNPKRRTRLGVSFFLKDHNTIDAKHNSYLADGAYRI